MSKEKIQLGLRVDVDTLRGTRLGVPALTKLLGAFGVRASFFFSVGPDNMGRNIYRLFRPGFLWKMARSRAPSLYGWDILLKGTLWRGPIIGREAAECIREAAQAGHEIGVHAWDHYRWQNHLHRMSEPELEDEFDRAYKLLAEIAGSAPSASANPAWRSTQAFLKIKERYPFLYNSDCRGDMIFLPLLNREAELEEPASIPQIPVTLPTFDELIGTRGIRPEKFNNTILSRLKPERLNVYTIHAEVEGIACYELFSDFMQKCREREVEPVALGSLLDVRPDPLPHCRLEERTIPGRDGKVAMPAADCEGEE
jgi:undecaprenyl phosphate-alpha-L-ara4FN deformylase